MEKEILKKAPLFCDMNEIEVSNILENLKYEIRDYKSNCVVVSEKDEFRKLGIVMDGEISIQKIFPHGKAVILNKLKPGEIFGLSSFFEDKRNFPTNIITFKKSRIMFIDQKNLIEILSSNTKLLNNFMKFCTNRIMFLNSRIEIFLIDGAEKRIAYYILSQAVKNQSDEINLPFPKKDWAEFLSVSRASLFRELKRLRENNLIKIEGRKIFILNLPFLRKVLSDL